MNGDGHNINQIDPKKIKVLSDCLHVEVKDNEVCGKIEDGINQVLDSYVQLFDIEQYKKKIALRENARHCKYPVFKLFRGL